MYKAMEGEGEAVTCRDAVQTFIDGPTNEKYCGDGFPTRNFSRMGIRPHILHAKPIHHHLPCPSAHAQTELSSSVCRLLEFRRIKREKIHNGCLRSD